MRRIVLLSLVPAAMLALAACGGGSAPATTSATTSTPGSTSAPTLAPAAYVRHAATKTAAASGEHMTMSGKVSGSGAQAQITLAGDFSNTQKQGSMHASFSAGGVSGSMDEVLDKTTLYLKSSLFGAVLPSGKTWVKLDRQELGKTSGIDVSALMTQSPSQALAQLAAVGSVSTVGSATIDGVETTEYRVRIDPGKLPQAAKIEALTHAKYGPFDIWVDNADGYVRRETMSISFATAGNAGTMSMTMSFSNFGEAVHVTIPPASETADASTLVLQGLGA